VQVWPRGKVVFPDFLLPESADVWEELIVKHYRTIRFDGLWIVSAQQVSAIVLSVLPILSALDTLLENFEDRTWPRRLAKLNITE